MKVGIVRFDTHYLAHPARHMKEGKMIQIRLEKIGITVINPFDRQIDDPIKWWSEIHSPEDCRRVVERDLRWIRESDALFAFVPDLTLCGTAMEIFYAAKVLEKPVFIYTVPQYRFHPWLAYYGQVFTDLNFMMTVLELRKQLEGLPFKIALGGKMGSGKTTHADFLEKTFQFKKYSFAAKLKEIAKDLFDMEGKNRALLQNLGATIRSMEEDTWVDYTLRHIKMDNPLRVVIDDMRYLNEAEKLRKNGFILIKLVSNNRTGAGYSEETAKHPSETEIDQIQADYTINTDKPIEYCYVDIMMVLEKEFVDRCSD